MNRSHIALAALVLLANACAGNVAPAPTDDGPVCGSAASVADLQNSGCDDHVYSYVVTCSAAVENPGLEGECKTPPVGELGIMRELPGGLAPVWCCK